MNFDINDNEHEFILLPNEAVEFLIKTHNDKFQLTPKSWIKKNLKIIEEKTNEKIITFKKGIVKSKEKKWLVYHYTQSS